MPWATLKLNDGHKIPGIAFGSAGHAESVTADVIDTAIDVGFEHLDTAQNYGNETAVGKGVKLSALPRSSLFLTTKWSGLAPIKQSIRDSLDHLGVEYVDLYLIHSPRWAGEDLERRWKEFEELHKQGLSRSIGVSNFNKDQLKRILHIANVKPAVNQIFLHPGNYHDSKPLLEFMANHDILVEAYSPLWPLRVDKLPEVVKAVNRVAEEVKVKPELVLLAWSKAKGFLPITTSSNRDRAASYIAAGDINLTDDQIEAIDQSGVKAAQRKQRDGVLLMAAKGALTIGVIFLCARRILA